MANVAYSSLRKIPFKHFKRSFIFFKLMPGVVISFLVAIAAIVAGAISEGPDMLFALIFGMLLHPFTNTQTLAPGIGFTSKTLLRAGVALLGLRLTLEGVLSLGLETLCLAVGAVIFTIVTGILVGRYLNLSTSHSTLCAGAVAICGASAALAICAVLPQDKQTENRTAMVIAGVTVLSTIAMVLYPILTKVLNLSDETAGILLGATIHDVAQVIGAGYAVSESAGDSAVIVKLTRVACLAPVVIVLSFIFCKSVPCEGRKPITPMPLFMVIFLLLVIANSFDLFHAHMISAGSEASRFFLVAGVAALGCKTSLTAIKHVGIRPLTLICTQTLLLLTLVTSVLMFTGA